MAKRKGKATTAIPAKKTPANKSAKKVAAKTPGAVGAASSTSGPPPKKQKTAKGSVAIPLVGSRYPKRGVHAPESPPPPEPPKVLGLIKPPPNVAAAGTALQFPMPANLPVGHPTIYYGENAPFPRWRTLLDFQAPNQDREQNLIRTHPQETIIPGVSPLSHPRAYDRFIGLGGLRWNFEPGPPTFWLGLTGQQLHTHAHHRLIEALENPFSRQQLRQMIRNEQFAAQIANVEDPLPPAPRLDRAGPAGPNTVKDRIEDSVNRIENRVQSFPGRTTRCRYERPELNYRQGEEKPGKEDLIALRLMANMRGTLGPPDYQAPSLNPTARIGAAVKLPPPSALAPAARMSSKGRSKGIQQGPGSIDFSSEERIEDIQRDMGQVIPEPPEIGMTPSGDVSKITRIGEYKCVWFIVILLILSMMLCLLLYSFNIIR
ncbi:uncharacterized protein N7482_000580 [Penicillium canariense]|uniref:Uncharacterized protein n=1 Tax=Penicillium canariense TaxID=189055 RepID=A0A9W9IDL4_9EURO|nr:uncharacterized protein N7482_000580 [Penicillium canariense]KAJ5174703.1 hypothetical protein N7482_000580 [Penicillium canariense]